MKRKLKIKPIYECRCIDWVYYESKREPKIRGMNKCRCDERLQTKTKEFTRLPYTGLVLELEHLKIETRLIIMMFASGTNNFTNFFFFFFICSSSSIREEWNSGGGMDGGVSWKRHVAALFIGDIVWHWCCLSFLQPTRLSKQRLPVCVPGC